MKFYSKAEIEEAKAQDLVSFINANYSNDIVWDVKKKRWSRTDQSSVEIFSEEKRRRSISRYPSMSWYDFSEAIGGDNIEYLTRFHGLCFTDAVGKLLPSSAVTTKNLSSIDIYVEQETVKIVLPEKQNENLNNIIRYLCDIRKISRNIVCECINQERLYADNHSNCVFFNPETEFYILRGTMPNRKFCKNSSGNDFWEYITSEPVEKVYITEAPIDALSLCHLLGKPQNCSFAAMGGLKPLTYQSVLEKYSTVGKENTFCCTDWDAAGEQFYSEDKGQRLKPKISVQNHTKDWNEILVLIKQKERH